MFGGLSRWLPGRKEIEASPAPDMDDNVFQLPEGLAEEIAAVELAALAVYARHDLPVTAGGYRQCGPEAVWEKLPDDLTPLDKMMLLEDAPEGGQWRFADRSGIGRTSHIAEVRRASVLLAACEGLRARLSGCLPTTAQDVADALHLGAASGWLAGAATDEALPDTTEAHSPLVFHAPESHD